MDKLIHNYIINIIINKDKSINQQVKELQSFFIKINKLNKPHNDRFYLVEEFNDKKTLDLIYWIIRHNEYSEYEPLTKLSQEIADIVQYNENMTVFTKYI